MRLYDYQLEAGRLYAPSGKFERKLGFALAGIEAMIELCPRSYVSVSFGKQSLCLAHMIYKIAPQTPMYFLASSESWWLHNFGQVIGDFMDSTPVDLTIVQTNRLGLDLSEPMLELSARQPGIKWILKGWDETPQNWEAARAAGHEDLQEMCDRQEWDGWVWGLAIEESFGRWQTLTKKWKGQPHLSIFKYKDGKYRCCPLMRWKVEEIAAYVATHGLRLLDEYEAHGLEARTTARATRLMALQGGLASLRRKAPDGYQKLIQQLPELRMMT